ncbi:saccharopine dehydrogenase family protein [Candidatus Bathyarchaeota archaeon]|jgi:saccharopine dehydrogenase-like NADP-dependent oxidoreductase|nr:saccharopine dehydrogenase family protein [Candidatus Bathyarchaeota archaeon]
MKVLIIGCGNIGSVSAQDLVKSVPSTEIVVADKNEKRAKDVAEKIEKDNVSWTGLDTSNHGELVNTLKGFDLAMGFLPGKLGYGLCKACIDAGKDLVDVSYMAENPMALNASAAKAGVTIVPDCGLAPGISNVLVGHAVGKLDEVKAVHVMVGGLPEKPVPPLGYTITWSPESLIDEYTRKVVIVKKGRKVEIEALSGVEAITFPKVGELEAFYTDGLRTLLYTMENVEEMWEKTLRYLGHAEKIKAFQTLGFFDEKKIDVEGVNVSPRKLTVKLIGEKLWKPEVKDIVVLKVEVVGVENGKKTSYSYHLLDNYDKKQGITAMARTTAYPASIVAQLMLKKAVKEKGVVPPEKIGMDKKLFSQFSDGLKKRGIKVSETRAAG